VVGYGDQQLGVFRSRALEDIRMRGVTGNCLDVQAVADLLRQVLTLIDDRDVIAGDRQIAADIVTDLSCAADNHLHGRGRPAASTWRRCLARRSVTGN
jgi:hypothetical protein